MLKNGINKRLKDLIILVKITINKTYKINGQIYNYENII